MKAKSPPPTPLQSVRVGRISRIEALAYCDGAGFGMGTIYQIRKLDFIIFSLLT